MATTRPRPSRSAAPWRSRSGFAEAENNLANALLALADHEPAYRSYRRALELRPDYVMAHSNLLMCEQYRASVTPEHLQRAHDAWDQAHAAALRPAEPSWEVTRDPDRRLRIGFISPDFCRHPVGFFLVPVIENLDPNDFEVVCYYARDLEIRDVITDRIRAASTEWGSILGLDTASLAERVRGDRIDILFDLSGHTGDHRLLCFARKPAPIQMTWMGYVGTTGLSTMDYLVADRFHVPHGAEAHYRERVLRMPDGYICFDRPTNDEAEPVGPLPAQEEGFVTFGSFNNLAKLTPQVLALWARVLDGVPGSHLMLASPGFNGKSARDRVTKTLGDHGIDAHRIEIRGGMGRPDLLASYNEVDIGLDPFPYSGGITTCEALWMGVPVVTCPGATFAGRHSFSHLSNVGLTETIAVDHDDYVAIARGLAGDLDRLAHIRAGLRDRMSNSPLCDGPRFGAHFGRALREVWQAWCQVS